MVDKEEVVEAINLLIECERYAKFVNEMTGILESWDQHPMAYAGDLTPLNALLHIGVKNRDKFERVLKFIESKRKERPKQRRQDYQRELMAQRRARDAKAIDLEELQHGPMSAPQKKKFLKELQERWAVAKEKFIQGQGRLTWDERNKKSQEFWASVDKRLDINLAHERQKKRGLT
jgi:hypothetical protein